MVGTFLATAGTTLLAMGAWWLLLSFNGWTLIAHCIAASESKPHPPPSPCPASVHPGAVLAIGLLPLGLLRLTVRLPLASSWRVYWWPRCCCTPLRLAPAGRVYHASGHGASGDPVGCLGPEPGPCDLEHHMAGPFRRGTAAQQCQSRHQRLHQPELWIRAPRKSPFPPPEQGYRPFQTPSTTGLSGERPLPWKLPPPPWQGLASLNNRP